MSEQPRDDDTQRYATAYPDGDFIEAVRSQETPTTVDVATAVGCSRTTAYPRLEALEEDGRLASEMIGSARVWRVLDS